MKIYRACITGTRNIEKKKTCQDYCDYMLTSDGCVAAALSDGAGSAKFADFGAMENVSAFLNFFRRYTTKEILNINDKALADDIIFVCKNAQNDLADRIGTDIKELSATLIGIIIGADEIAIFHIGDGGAYIKEKNGKVRCVSKPENILGIANRTYFTADEDATEHLRVIRIERESVDKICIFSDGVFGEKNEKTIIKEIRNIFDKAKSNRSLSKFIDDDYVKEYGDDHSMILVDINL